MLGILVLLCGPPLLGVLTGWLFGGRVVRLGTVARGSWWLLWIAGVLQALQFYVPAARRVLETGLHLPIALIVWGLILGWLASAARHWPAVLRGGAVLVLLGALANGAAIAANGRMPYSVGAAVRVGIDPTRATPKNAPAGAATRLPALEDFIPLDGLGKLVSPGDVAIAIGVTVVVAGGMTRRPRERAGSGEARRIEEVPT